MSKSISLRLSDRRLILLHSIRGDRRVGFSLQTGNDANQTSRTEPVCESAGRMAIQTHVLSQGDNLTVVARRYAQPLLQPGDILFLSEKAVACTQHRAIPLSEIHPRPLARLLCKFVKKTPYGIGLGIPETMEMALRECGTGRILCAALLSALGKLIGRHGWFYRVAGTCASSIDGPCSCTIPPYNQCVVLGPENPDEVAGLLARELGCQVAIVDINDLGAAILGVSDPSMNSAMLCEILRDNPLGQGRQSTPMGIIRRCHEELR